MNNTIDNIIPQKNKYLTALDSFKRLSVDEYEMPGKMVAQLAVFLEPNNGQL